jgi:hypothetical protein
MKTLASVPKAAMGQRAAGEVIPMTKAVAATMATPPATANAGARRRSSNQPDTMAIGIPIRNIRLP